jgi:hypothetical protein
MYPLHLSSGSPIESLKHHLLKISIFNLAVVVVLGVVLRSFPLIQVPFNYGYILHGHSHFAFGGWVMPILLWMILQYFPSISNKISFCHWRNISSMLLLSAYGMLVSFPIQGYAPVSIFFSTVSVLGGFYLAGIIWKATTDEKSSIPIKFLRAGLFYLCLSSLGPFATGPIVAMGGSGTPIYFNAIYFYLHFQYNGWFSFAILAVLTGIMERNKALIYGRTIFRLFNLACIPTFFLSILWNHPGLLFNVVGGIGAVITIIAVVLLTISFLKMNESNGIVKGLMHVAMVGLIIKVVLQFLSAFPKVADLAYHNRNFIIAYLHLVLLGFITLFAFAFIFKTIHVASHRKLKLAIFAFLFSFMTTETLLVLQASGAYFGLQIPNYSGLLLCCSLFFPVSIALLFPCIPRGYPLREMHLEAGA